MHIVRIVIFAAFFFFFNDTATTEIYTLSLHDALPIPGPWACSPTARRPPPPPACCARCWPCADPGVSSGLLVRELRREQPAAGPAEQPDHLGRPLAALFGDRAEPGPGRHREVRAARRAGGGQLGDIGRRPSRRGEPFRAQANVRLSLRVALAGREELGDLGPNRLQAHPLLAEHLRGDALPLPDQAQEDVFG